MNQGVVERVVDILNDTLEINKQDSLFFNIWSGGSYTSKNKSV